MAPPEKATLFSLRQQLAQDHAVRKEDISLLTSSEVASIRNLVRDCKAPQAQQPQRRTATDAAIERKERLRQIDNERKKKGVESLSPDDIEANQQRLEQLRKAQTQIDQDTDEVKYMDKVMHYARCVTIRDAQVREKAAIAAEQKEEERRRDMAMEMERLKAIKMYEERETKRVEDRRKGAAVIRAQMEERKQEELRLLELKNQEQFAMLRHIEKMKADDMRETNRKKQASKQLMEDVALANAEQIRLKARQRETEQEEERRITEYLREKEKREQELALEAERLRSDKEREIARLRSMQEKEQDKQAEMDAFRARRQQAEYERDRREQERQAREYALRINKELAAARDQQRAEKEAMLAEQAVLEAEEFERIVASQRAEDQIEAERRQQDKRGRRRHADDLQAQIAEVSERKSKEQLEQLEEGKKLGQAKKERDAYLGGLLAEKAAELEGSGVPVKYTKELLRKRPEPGIFPSK